MTPRFDIFKIEAGEATWLECVGTSQDCRKRLIELQPQHPDMVVWDSVVDIKYSVREFLAVWRGEGKLHHNLSDLEKAL